MGAYLQGQGGFTQLYDPTQWDLTPDASYTAGQATAIGISAKQLDTLKTRLENTKTQLQANNVQNLTGEQISGDLLTAVIWSWFAAAESHNRLSQNQAQMIENPGLSYGLFHAVANPIYSWGVVRKVTFPGVNMDIGHVRNITWAKDNDEKKWAAYNRLRGQYMSALEHAVPERFFNDPQKCNLQGASNPTAGLPDCPQGISAVKALGLAAAQGQRIYTITQKVYNDNPNIVNTALSAHSYDTQNRVQQSLDAGYEVTIHESPIAESGWSGAGFIQIDPTTGAGGYTIEGGSNGGFLGCGDSIDYSVEKICAHIDSHLVPRSSTNWHDLDLRNAEHFWFAYELSQLLGPFGFIMVLAVIIYEIGKYIRYLGGGSTCPTFLGLWAGVAGVGAGWIEYFLGDGFYTDSLCRG